MKLRDILIKVAEADERDLYTLLKIIGRKRRREFLHTLKRCIEGYEPSIERLPVPVKDKRISGADRADSSVERMDSNDKAVLLQRRAREQTIRPGINAKTLPDTESV